MAFSIKLNTIRNGLHPEALNNKAVSLPMNKPGVGSHKNVDAVWRGNQKNLQIIVIV